MMKIRTYTYACTYLYSLLSDDLKRPGNVYEKRLELFEMVITDTGRAVHDEDNIRMVTLVTP
jgi:hypothetical protein